MINDLRNSVKQALVELILKEQLMKIMADETAKLSNHIPDGWKVASENLFGASSNTTQRLFAITIAQDKKILIDLDYIMAYYGTPNVAKGIHFWLWKHLMRTVIRQTLKHECRHAAQLDYFEQNGIAWQFVFIAESHTAYENQIVEKDAIKHQNLVFKKSVPIAEAMAPLMKIIRG